FAVRSDVRRRSFRASVRGVVRAGPHSRLTDGYRANPGLPASKPLARGGMAHGKAAADLTVCKRWPAILAANRRPGGSNTFGDACMKTRRTFHRSALATAALLALTPAAFATDYTWTSGSYPSVAGWPDPLAAGDVLYIQTGGAKY